MKVTKRQLRRIIREEVARLKRQGLIRESRQGLIRESYGPQDGIMVDWAAEVNPVLAIQEQYTSLEVQVYGESPNGFPEVEVTGPLDVLKDWYVNSYMGGDSFAADDFDEFVQMI